MLLAASVLGYTPSFLMVQTRIPMSRACGDVRDVAYARLAFTNGLLLEQRKMVAMVSSNLPQGSAQVAVAERIEQYGGKLEPVVEDASLDSIVVGAAR